MIETLRDTSKFTEIENKLTLKMGELANACTVRETIEELQMKFEKDLDNKWDKSEGQETVYGEIIHMCNILIYFLFTKGGASTQIVFVPKSNIFKIWLSKK